MLNPHLELRQGAIRDLPLQGFRITKTSPGHLRYLQNGTFMHLIFCPHLLLHGQQGQKAVRLQISGFISLFNVFISKLLIQTGRYSGGQLVPAPTQSRASIKGQIAFLRDLSILKEGYATSPLASINCPLQIQDKHFHTQELLHVASCVTNRHL